MKKTFKKVISVLLVTVMVFGSAPLAGLVGLELPEFNLFGTKAEAATSGYFTYSVSNNKAIITEVSTSISGSVTIPATLGGYPVTDIGHDAFRGCTGLTSATIPDSVTFMGQCSFYNCTRLKSVTIGNGVTNIGFDAFDNTGLYNDSTNWENNVLYIGNYLIEAKTTISGDYTIKTGTKVIADYAFKDCTGLTSVTIPDSVTSIGNSTFNNCTGLTSVTIGNSVTSIDNSAFKGCTGLTSVTIPDSVTSIDGFAFENCTGLTSVTIPDSVTFIGYFAFKKCTRLKSVTIGNGVTNIGFDAFDGCNNLSTTYYVGTSEQWRDISIGSGNDPIERKIIFECNSERPYYDKGAYGDNLTWTLYTDGELLIDGTGDITDYSSSSNAPWYSKRSIIRSVTIGNGVTSIGEDAFYDYTGLTSVTIGNDVKTIGDRAFKDCTGLTSVTIGNSVTSIGYYAFSGCTGLTSITIPDSVTSIGGSAFYGCTRLTSVTIPNSVTSIGDRAFYDCTGLTIVTIGNGVKTIGYRAFYNTGLDNDSNNWENNVLYIGNYLIKAKTTISGDYTIKTGTKVIADYAFDGCTKLTSVTIPDGVTSIGDKSFRGCTGLTSVTIPDSVTSIDGYAFKDCTGLTSVTIGNSVTSIGYSAFVNTGLYNDSTNWENGVLYIGNYLIEAKTTISGDYTIKTGTKAIADYAFSGCTGLTSVTIGNSVTSIGSYAFKGCTGLAGVTIPNGVTGIGSEAFSGCTGLTSITVDENNTNYSSDEYGVLFNKDKTELIQYPIGNERTEYIIPDSVTSIGSYAFYKCTGLTSVTIPNSVTSIGSYAFSGCTGLTSITIPNSVTSIGSYAFSGCTGLTELAMPVSAEIYDTTFQNCKNINNITLTKGTGIMEAYSNSTSSSCTYYQYTPWYISGCNNIIIEDGVKIISYCAFYGCTGLTSVTIGNDVTSIGYESFRGCTGLASVTIPDSVTSIDGYAFKDCTGLTSVTIGNSVTSIGYYAFSGCNNIATTYYTGTPDQWRDISIDSSNDPIERKIIFECNSERPYYDKDTCGKNLTWTLYTDGELVIDGTGDMTDYSSSSSLNAPWYSKSSIIKSATIGNGVTSIGDESFRGCTGLTSITIPDSVTSIGWCAFYNTGLYNDSTNWENNVLYIGNYLIKAETTISGDYTIKTGTKVLANSAFYNCTGLTSVTISDSVIIIGDEAFSGCNNIATTYYTGTLEQWGNISIGSYNSAISKNIIFECNSESPNYGKGSCGDNLTWTLYTDGELVIEGTGDMTDYSSSSNVPWHSKRSIIKSVTIPNGITSISNYSFTDCTRLTSITIPDSVTSIGSSAFSGCTGLTSITIPDSVTSIGSSAFSGCTGLTSITIPDSVTSIGSSAFSGCTGLTSITIPDSVTSIGSSAFYGCTRLTSISIPDSVTTIGDDAFYNTGLYNNSYNWKNSILYIGTHLIEAKTTISGDCSVKIGTKIIADSAFESCTQVEYVHIPESITNIGENAFYNCSKLDITYYTGTQEQWNDINIGSGNGCLLDYILFNYDADNPNYGSGSCGESLTWILTCDGDLIISGKGDMTDFGSYYAPWYPVRSKINSISIGGAVTSIGAYAFESCNIEDIQIPDRISEIGKGAFRNSKNINNIVIPDSVTSIGDGAFYGCTGLTSITIPDSVTSIGDSMFYGCTGLTSVTIPYSVTSIGDYAFKGCTGLTGVTIPNGVTGIGSEAFSGCAGLTSIAIPDSVTNIMNGAFKNCSSLTTVKIGNGVTDIGQYAFSDCSKLLNLTVGNSVESIGYEAFYNCSELVSVILPNSIKEVGDEAFRYCSSLKNITFGKSLESVGEWVFGGCNNLTNYYFTGSIGDMCKVNYTNSFGHPMGFASNIYVNGKILEGDIVIPEGTAKIGNYAFYNSAGIKSITIPDSVKSIGSFAFTGCESLAKVYYTGDLSAWCDIVFTGSTSLLEYADYFYIDGKSVGGTLVIPEDVSSINSYAFENCFYVTSLIIPDNVLSIGKKAFFGCQLKTVRIGKNVSSIDSYAFYDTRITRTDYPESWEKWNEISIGSKNDKLLDYVVYECDSERPYIGKGSCGESLSWILYHDGELVISGTGNMTDFASTDDVPWNPLKYRGNVSKVTITNGVTSIGSYAFADHYFTKINIGKDVASIGQNAFYNCYRLTTVYYEGSKNEWSAITIGKNNEELNSTLIYECNSERPYYYSGSCGENLTFVYYIDGSLVISGSGPMINYSSGTSSPWSERRTEIKSVSLPEGITSIGNYAFYNCTGVKEFSLPSDITSIGSYSFAYCNGISEIEIPENVRSIGGYAFKSCANLKNVTIPLNMTSISAYAFDECSKITVTRYAGTKSQWNNISIGSNNSYLINNVQFECYSHRPYFVGTYGDNLSWILYSDGELIISGTGPMTDYSSASSVPWYNKRSMISKVIIEEGITSIGAYALYYCSNIESISIPRSVTSIGASAFEGCSNKKDVYYSGELKDWCAITFSNVESTPFYNVNAFYVNGKIVTDLIIPEDVTVIGAYTFAKNKSLKSVTLHDGVSSIGKYAFYFCTGIESVAFGKGTKIIGESAFDGCDSLENLVITDNITTIGSDAFGYCSNLKSVKIGNGLSLINKYAFYQCNELAHAYYPGTPDDWYGVSVAAYNESLTNNLVYECNSENPYFAKGTCGEGTEWIITPDNELIIKGVGDMENYTSSSSMPWYNERDLIKKVIIADGVTSIGDYAFFNCNNLTSVTMSDDVETIGNNAFNDCEKISELTIGNGVKTIGEYAFADNTSLTNVVIPDSVETVGNSAFRVCDAITSVTIGNGVTTIGDYAFSGCWSLSEIVIGKNVEAIGNYAFNECDELSEVSYDGTAEEWETVSIGIGNDNLTALKVGFSEYKVSWTYDNETYNEYVKVGNELTPPSMSEKAGYSFVGWTPEIPETMPASDMSFTAIFKANSYNAVFNANGGAWSDGETTKTVATDFDSEIIAPEAPEKQGYIFSGWSPKVGTMDDVNGKAFNAVWIASTDTRYTVETYTMNTEGEYVKTVQNYTGETDSTANAEYTVAKGFTLNEEKSVLSGVISADNSLVLKVYFDRNKYTFTSVVDGTATETEYLYGSIIAEPATPVKTGYTFAGWDKLIPKTMPAEDFTVTARFTANSYNAVFDANGGKWSGGATTKTVATDFGSNIVAPANPTRQGYDFAGWDNEIGIMDDVNGKTFSAKWTARNDTKYTIEIYTMDAYGKYTSSKETKKGTTDTEATVTANAQTGFTVNSTKSNLSGNIAGDGSLVLRIYYDRNKYKFITNIDGNTTSKDYYYDAPVTMPANPDKPGYKFIGWDKTIPSKMPANDVTVTAVFEQILLKMSIRNPSTTTIKYGDKIILHADMNEALPNGWTIKWAADNGNFSYSVSADGSTCTISPSKSGSTNFKATVYDEKGNVFCEDTQSMTSKAGFFDKIGAFFRKLFGSTKTIPQLFKGIF